MKRHVKRKKKGYKYIIVSLIIIIIVLISSTMIVTVSGAYYDDKGEYLELYDDYLSVRENLIFQSKYLEVLQEKEAEFEDELYDAFNSYFNNSTDEIFRYVFAERFPSYYEYEEDRKQAFIVIYALLELYPELKDDENISFYLGEIDTNLDKIRTVVEEYNTDLNSYDSILVKINHSEYITKWKKAKVITEVFMPMEFIEAN